MSSVLHHLLLSLLYCIYVINAHLKVRRIRFTEPFEFRSMLVK